MQRRTRVWQGFEQKLGANFACAGARTRWHSRCMSTELTLHMPVPVSSFASTCTDAHLHVQPGSVRMVHVAAGQLHSQRLWQLGDCGRRWGVSQFGAGWNTRCTSHATGGSRLWGVRPQGLGCDQCGQGWLHVVLSTCRVPVCVHARVRTAQTRKLHRLPGWMGACDECRTPRPHATTCESWQQMRIGTPTHGNAPGLGSVPNSLCDACPWNQAWTLWGHRRVKQEREVHQAGTNTGTPCCSLRSHPLN